MAGEMHGSETVFYPVFVNLRGRLCLVVGAGKVAARKVRSLLEAGARVKVVGPEAVEAVEGLAARGVIQWQRRAFEPGDIDGCLLVIGATGNHQVNRRVFEAAERAGILANIVDVPELCNFIVPSVMKRGAFQVAVSTGGASPVLAREARRRLERSFGPQYGKVVRLLAKLRASLKQRLPAEEKRRRFWEAMIDLDYFDNIHPERVEQEIMERAERCLSQLED